MQPCCYTTVVFALHKCGVPAGNVARAAHAQRPGSAFCSLLSLKNLSAKNRAAGVRNAGCRIVSAATAERFKTIADASRSARIPPSRVDRAPPFALRISVASRNNNNSPGVNLNVRPGPEPSFGASFACADRFAGIRRHVVGPPRPARGSPEAQLHRHGPLPLHADGRLPARQARPFGRPGPCRCRAQDAGEGRHHLPHLLDDQADHLGRVHDAGRGGARRDRRAGAQIHPGVEEPRRLCRRHSDARHQARRRAAVHHQARCPADADRRPAAAHVRASLTASRTAPTSMPPIASCRSARSRRPARCSR